MFGVRCSIGARLGPLLLFFALLTVDGRAGSLPELVTPETDAAVQRGLKFLASHQREGCWSALHGETAQSQEGYSVYHTGLCGLVLLQSGSTPHEGPYSEHIMRATRHLMGLCHEDGFISIPGDDARSMYGHGMAMLFLSQAYGMLHDTAVEKQLSNVLTRAVAFSARYQSVNGGWNYTPTTAGDEGSVAITQIHGLRACHNAGIPVPKAAMDKFVTYIEKLECLDGSLSYTPQDGGSKGPGRMGVTAAGAASFFFSGANEHPLGKRLQKYISVNYVKGGGMADTVGHAEYIRFCLGTALFLWNDGNWPTYFRSETKSLLPAQLKNGSWVTPRIGDIYGTAMALYFLQLPYRMLPVLQQ